MFINIRPVLKICLSNLNSSSCRVPKAFALSISTSSSCFRTFRSPIKFTKRGKTSEEQELAEEGERVFSNENGDLDYLVERSFLCSNAGHQVFVIQPYIKWGPQKKKNTTPELQLLESVTLIKTLREWKVVDQIIISLETFQKNYFFGKGNLELLKNKVETTPTITSIFISVNTLTLQQQLQLEEVFGVPVFDRYTIIMHIFKEHAQTKEAKLQVQLAQLPYLWRVIKGFNQGLSNKLGVETKFYGGHEPKLLEERKEILKAKEAKLKREIAQLRENRSDLRKKREKHDIPVVAVIGYTNSGKTSLIKELTGKKTLEPQDYLFATLDVTSHLGVLPSGLKTYFVDTLGFINDIPTYLIESFVATLEDATMAHLIIHVRDVSHPDTAAQNDNVISTLESLNIPDATLGNIITVGNKIDLLEKEQLQKYKDMILISCKNLTGIDILRQEVERRLLLLENNIKITIRVESGGMEYNWLHQQSTVVSEVPDSKDSQFMQLNVIISSKNLAKFKHHFIKNYKQR